MIGHDRARELAAIALDFQLSTTDRTALQEHLAACDACRDLAQELSSDARDLAALPADDASADLRRRIMEAAGVTDVPPVVASSLDETRFIQRIPRAIEPYRWPVVAVAAAAVVVALIGGTLAWPSRPATSPGVAVVDPSASAPSSIGSGGPGVDPTPGASPGPPLVATTWTPVAELTAADATGGVLALRNSFRLTSLDTRPAAELARRLRVEPKIAFRVAPEEDGRSVRLTPTEPLSPGAVYRFTLAGDDGQTLGSWAFQASRPLRVVGTLPNHTDTDVPVDTGIEVTFDQDGVVDAASHLSIEPSIAGRFEQHGRVLAFIPERRLEPATIYTVTVSRGVSVGTTGEALEREVRFQFETAAGAGYSTRRTTLQFSTDVFESATADRPAISLWAFMEWGESEEEPAMPTEARLEIYRFPDVETAIAGFRQIRAFPRWSRWSPGDLVPTTGLQRVAGLDARLEEYEGGLWTRLPDALPGGWYLVHHPDATRPIQAVLQITDIASYLSVSDTRTVLWANDVASGGPLAGATVRAEGADVGRTTADGSLLFDTPAALLPDDDACRAICAPVVTIRAGGDEAFVPAAGSRDPDGKDSVGFDGERWSDGDPRFWNVFHTDRTVYRRTDTINVWGLLRDRDSGDIPPTVAVRLLASGTDGDGASGPSLVTISATTRPSGAFTGSVVLRDVPEGEYRLQLTTGADVVAEVGVRVDRILKPAYRLEITTGRRVYIAGDRIRVTARATFYEGSPVPGLPLLVDGFLDASAPTDATGTATLRTVARAAGDDESEGHSVESVAVRPARAEEGEIAGASREFIVFPSSWTIRGDTELRDGRVHVNGAVNVVDRDRLESEIADGTSAWDLDPRGDPVAGAAVIATFTEFVPVRRQTGTTYDFIEKKVVPTYDYTVTERDLGSIRLTTNARGAFATSVPARNSDHSYRVKLSATDPDGHVARSASDVNGGADAERQGVRGATLEPTDDPTGERRAFGVGDEIDLTMRDPDVAVSDEDRYLFYVAQRGIREAAVRSSARFTTTFDDRAPPGIRILGVRFTGSGYVVSDGFWAEFRVSDRAITVGLTPDKDRYRPGDEVTMQVTTRAGDGRPLAASVVLRVVDEKLFAIDAAESVDPLLELYRSVDDGIRATYRSHQTPRARSEGGDTGGGDERADFRDSVLFRAIDTGSDGNVSVTFRLSDDITSWRVSGAALATDLRAGEAFVRIPVGLPFFVDAAVAPEYLVSDRPSIQVRAFGSALEADSRVTFSVDADSLGLHVDDLRADAFAAVTVKLPTLTLGRHTITFTARSGSGDAARRDRLTRTITVVESRLTRTRTAYQDLTEATRLQGGGGLNEIIVSDASSGRYLPLLIDLAAGESARLERGLAADLAASLIAELSGRDGHEPGAAFDGSHYQTPDGGLAILPYSSSDLAVSALAAIVAPDRFDRQRLDVYLSRIADDEAETRERRMYALSGRAGLGSAVLPDIAAAAADPELTIRERLMLGLGAAALGDATTARTIAADLVERYGEGVDDQARLRVGDEVSDVTAATAMMAVLAAWNGDPLADRFWAYVEANPSTEAPHALHAVAYVARIAAQRVPSSASFRYRVGDEATVVELEPGGSFHLSLTADRLADLTIEPVSGSIGVTTSWTEPVKATAFEVDPDITIERTITPAATIGTADLVIVDLTVSFGPRAPAGCHRVTDLVPSGLVMVGALHAWRDPDEPTEGASDAGVSFPYEQIGQRARFCAEATPPGRSAHLRYFARVVTPGVYTWEPAIVESRTGLDRAATTNVGEIVIR